MNICDCERLALKMHINIQQLYRLMDLARTENEKILYETLAAQEGNRLDIIKGYIKNMKTFESLKEITYEELAQNNGKEGKNAYVAIDGIVYDVTNEASWGGATHFGLEAGKDLSKEIASCHKKEEIVAKLLKVGVLKQ